MTCVCVFVQAREEGKSLLRQISTMREQGESSSDPNVFNPLSNTTHTLQSVYNNTTPIRRVSPLDLSSITPWPPKHTHTV